MTKELKRLNIKPYYCAYPTPKSGHRNIYIRYRANNQKSYSVCMYEAKYGSKSFRNKSDALCWKFIIILIHKTRINKIH
tara:strand:- start:2314 stop:2550 length:237 start_codon:yes stop_codon:yes gene_type:complete